MPSLTLDPDLREFAETGVISTPDRWHRPRFVLGPNVTAPKSDPILRAGLTAFNDEMNIATHFTYLREFRFLFVKNGFEQP